MGLPALLGGHLPFFRDLLNEYDLWVNTSAIYLDKFNGNLDSYVDMVLKKN